MGWLADGDDVVGVVLLGCYKLASVVVVVCWFFGCDVLARVMVESDGGDGMSGGSLQPTVMGVME